MDIVTLVKELAAGGFASFLVAILVAGRYRVWVWGHQLDDMLREKNAQLEYERKQKDEWRALALANRDLVERSVTVAGKAVGA